MILEKTYNRQNTHLLQSLLGSTESQAQALEMQLYLINNSESIDLEQSCLVRLKKQREKIEELAKVNETLRKELTTQKEEKNALQKRIQELEENEIQRVQYEELKFELEKVLNSHQLAQFEIEELKIELENVVTSSEEEIDQLKNILKRERESSAFSIAHLEACLADKDEELRKVRRQSKSAENHLNSKIEVLSQENTKLRESLKSQGIQLEQSEQLLKQKIKTKETDLLGFQKVIDHLKKQINVYKLELSTLKYDYQKERQEYLQMIEQNRMAMKLITRQKESKSNQNMQLRQEVKRYQFKNKSLQQTTNHLKSSLNKFKSQTQACSTKQSQSQELEKRKLEQMIARLKKEIEKHVEEYNLLSIELKRAKAIILQKEHHEKQRKVLLMSQFREIDKIQKEVTRQK